MSALRRYLSKIGWKGERGFTLAELLVVTALVGLVMAGIFTLLMSSNQSYMRGTNQVEAQQSARVAMARLMQEIREAGYNPRGVITFDPIVTFSATGFTIQNDWNANGVIDNTLVITDPVKGTGRGEQTIYALSGNNLTRRETGVDAAALNLISGVQALSFQFLDINDAATATASAIRTVVITATVSQNTGPASGALESSRVVLTNRVRLRNK